MWDNICRLCSSRGDYDIFSIIPAYLHASPNEFLHWQKPINKLLEETTGLLVATNDGLPQKMCALCISYLKHASTFRQQAINNAVSLKAVSALSCKNKSTVLKGAVNQVDTFDDKASVLITANDLIFSDERKTDANKRVNILNNQSSKITKSDEYMKKFLLVNDGAEKNTRTNCGARMVPQDEGEEVLPMTYLNLLFEKGNSVARKCRRLNYSQAHRRLPENDNLSTIFDQINNAESDPLGEEFQTASSDENEALEQKSNFFSYKEKNFEEDDVMDLDELKAANITINIPETCKERKCRACFRRFMFEDSYKEHMNTCIEYKFLLFIEEINRLLDIRRSKAVSPHEFIRRMIFCLRKTCQWLKTSCGEIILPDLLINGEAKNRLESDGKNSTAEISSGGNSDETIEKFTQGNKPKNEVKKTLFDILKHDANSSLVSDGTIDNIYLPMNELQRSHQDKKGKLQEKPLDREGRRQSKFENILSLIDSSCSDEKQTTTKLLLLEDLEGKKLIEEVSVFGCTKIVDQRSNFIEKLKNASLPQYPEASIKNASLHTSNISFPSFYKDMNISARCNTCNTVFESVASLESHNANFHNSHKPESYDDHKNIISLFEEDNVPVDNVERLNHN